LTANDFPNYEKEEARIEDFLRTCRTPNVRKGVQGDARYVAMAELVAQRKLTRVSVALDDVQLVDPALAASIEKNAFRYQKLFADAFDKLLPPPTGDIVTEDVFDVIQAHRLRQLAEPADDAAAGGDPEAAKKRIKDSFPPSLSGAMRCASRLAPRQRPDPLRRSSQPTSESSSRSSASLCARATSSRSAWWQRTRATSAAPSFTRRCGRLWRQGTSWSVPTPPSPARAATQVTGKTFMPSAQMHRPRSVRRTRARAGSEMQVRLSGPPSPRAPPSHHLPASAARRRAGASPQSTRSCACRNCRIRSPVGHIPRSMLVIARGDSTRECIPGDSVHITGARACRGGGGARSLHGGLGALPVPRPYPVYRHFPADATLAFKRYRPALPRTRTSKRTT